MWFQFAPAKAATAMAERISRRADFIACTFFGFSSRRGCKCHACCRRPTMAIEIRFVLSKPRSFYNGVEKMRSGRDGRLDADALEDPGRVFPVCTRECRELVDRVVDRI